MKSQSPKFVGLRLVLCLSIWTVVPRSVAQSAASLDLQLYGGLTITGAVGTVYQIQYLTNLAAATNPGTWHCLEFLQLPATRYLWTDKSAPARPGARITPRLGAE